MSVPVLTLYTLLEEIINGQPILDVNFLSLDSIFWRLIAPYGLFILVPTFYSWTIARGVWTHKSMRLKSLLLSVWFIPSIIFLLASLLLMPTFLRPMEGFTSIIITIYYNAMIALTGALMLILFILKKTFFKGRFEALE